MKLYYFSEMPHHEFPDEEGLKYPSLRLEFPNRFFNPAIAALNYQRYLDEYEFADQAGFAGLMINEHHSTPSCVDVSVNMTAGILARITRRAKILLLGNILPIQDSGQLQFISVPPEREAGGLLPSANFAENISLRFVNGHTSMMMLPQIHVEQDQSGR